MPVTAPFNFKAWIDEHRHLLKPPVGNQCVYTEAEDFIVMVVGGPNARKDYHYNEGEEFFYQVEGDIVLKIIDEGKPVDIPIREGEIFLLPPGVPHSPQRPADTVGLVMETKRRSGEIDGFMETKRRSGEIDGFMWFCESCGEKLYDERFELEDIVSQLPPVMNRFFGSEEHRTCKLCGAVMPKPQGG
jgi:3-hydroxyanthranilate 3,4-dioxygenase